MSDQGIHSKRPLPSPSPEQPPSQRLKTEEELDEINKKIARTITTDGGRNIPMSILLTVMAMHCKEINGDFVDWHQSDDFLRRNPEIERKLREAYDARSFKDVLQLRTPPAFSFPAP